MDFHMDFTRLNGIGSEGTHLMISVVLLTCMTSRSNSDMPKIAPTVGGISPWLWEAVAPPLKRFSESPCTECSRAYRVTCHKHIPARFEHGCMH